MASSTPAASSASASSSDPALTRIGAITVYDEYTHRLQAIPVDSHPAPFLLRKYVEEHVQSGRQSNQFVYEKDAQFQLQLRTGPLVHQTFHVQSGEEWLYVLEGEALVRVVNGSAVEDLPLPVGTCVLIPARTPKSLQLCAGAQVLVMTRARKTKATMADPLVYGHYNQDHPVPELKHLNGNAREELDALDQLIWLCEACHQVAHSVEFECTEFFAQSTALCADFDTAVAGGKQVCRACQATVTVKSVLDSSDASLTTIAAMQARFPAAPSSSAVRLSPAFPLMNPPTHPPPYHLFSWVDANKSRLTPPVCNAMIHGRGCQWKVMIVGGPNQRTDYHIDDGEEWFLMIKGAMTLKVVDKCGTEFRDIPIGEGESFLLPANVPHSPQRYADTIGLVIERERFTHELDGLRWWCANQACRHVLRTFSFRCEDLGSQLKTLIEYWYEDSPEGRRRRTCQKCAQEEVKPATLAQVKVFTH